MIVTEDLSHLVDGARGSFPLAAPAVAGTLRVHAGGLLLPDADVTVVSSVLFSIAPPEVGESLAVEYSTLAEEVGVVASGS